MWEGDGFNVLDETLIPERIEYLRVNEVSQAIEAVAQMRTRAFGQVLTFFYAGALIAQGYRGEDTGPLECEIAGMTRQFCAVRPTFDFKGLGHFFTQWFGTLPKEIAAGPWIANRAREFAAQIVKSRGSRAQRAAALLPDPCHLLTHCNVSGELVAVARHCAQLGKRISVIATETRPYLQGSRLTAWELARAGVTVSIIPDCAIAQVMQRGHVNAVLVGADRVARNGDVVNKVGTYPLALMAQEHAVPFYALVQDPRELARGDDVEIEERPASELLTFQGKSVIGSGGERLLVRYPVFDVTPAALITSLIGFDGVYTPESFRKKYQADSARNANENNGGGKYLLIYGVPRPSSYDYLAKALKAEPADGLLVPEMRPQLWGARVVAPELVNRGTAVTLISDNMMGTLFARREVKRLFFFYTGLNESGAAGICGALLSAHLARAHRIPIELLESRDLQITLPDCDVSTFLGERASPPGAAIYPIEREMVPWKILNGAAT